jgi:uncharacterized membrane-anchored protein
MKQLKTILFSILITFLFSSFYIPKKGKDYQKVLLVLEDPIHGESFSVFMVTEVDEVFVGINTDEYFVHEGLYRIEGTSNDKLYHKNILVIGD